MNPANEKPPASVKTDAGADEADQREDDGLKRTIQSENYRAFARCLAQEFFREYAIFRSFCDSYEREGKNPMDHVADYFAGLDKGGDR